MELEKLEKKIGFLNETVGYYIERYFEYWKNEVKTWTDFKNENHLNKMIEIIQTNVAGIDQYVDLKEFIKNKFKRRTIKNEEQDLVKGDVDDILLENVRKLKEQLENKKTEVHSVHSELELLENDFLNFKKEVLKIKTHNLDDFQKKLNNSLINDVICNTIEKYNRDIEKDDDPSIDVNVFKTSDIYKRLLKEIYNIDQTININKINEKINYFGSARYKYENNTIKCNIDGAKGLSWMKVSSFIKNRKRYNKIRGVYIFWNRTKNLFYVGQSKNLRNRIGGYFNYDTLECISKKFGHDFNAGDEFYLSLKKLDTSEQCDLIERKFIKIFNSFKGPGYNKTSGNI